MTDPQKAYATEGGVHVVRPGETLSSIAQKYSGDAGMWPAIWAMNRDQLPTINTPLQINQSLRIPWTPDVWANEAKVREAVRLVEQGGVAQFNAFQYLREALAEIDRLRHNLSK